MDEPQNVGVKGNNRLPASGGRDGETIEEAVRRIPGELHHRGRAVAADDFVALALQTPDVLVGRVEVLARFKPQERLDEVPGVVTLVVVPARDSVTPDTPTPDREMLRRVCAWLEPRRLVTTELYVIPPEYVEITCSVAIQPEDGFGIQTVRRWVELAVRQALAPLPPYGPSGAGWPIGRDVRVEDIQATVLQVQGVRLCTQVRLRGVEVAADRTKRTVDLDSENTSGAAAGVTLTRWQLPVVREVRVVEGDVATPIDEVIAPVVLGTGIAVPVARESC